MSKAPETYAEWVSILKALADGNHDDETLSVMREGKLAWQTGVAERFATRFADALNTRLNRATDNFQRKMQKNPTERELIQSLLDLRRNLIFLQKATQLPALPAEQQKAYKNLIVEQAEQIQKSLEASAKKDRTGKLRQVLRNHPVNRF